MKAYRGSRGIAPLILNLCTKWRRVVHFMARLLYHQEIMPVSRASLEILRKELSVASIASFGFCFGA
jgi:hypothetical protein